MPLTPGQLKTIYNHIPTCRRRCDIFITALEGSIDEVDKARYLKALLKKMKGDVTEVLDILDEVYPDE